MEYIGFDQLGRDNIMMQPNQRKSQGGSREEILRMGDG